MNKEEIQALIEKYYRAETSLEEEELLRAYFSKEENRKADPELADLMELYSRYGDIDAEEILEIPGPTDISSRKAIPWYYAAAASVAFLMVGLFVGRTLEQKSYDEHQLAALNNEIKEIKSLISYQQIESMSASEKIQVAYQFKEKDSIDTETVNSLISILHFDENPNVRLAAADALSKFNNNDKIRLAFLQALKKESNPVLQIKLIDVLILSKEKEAVPELRRIMEASEQNQVVKERAAYGISQLI